MAETCAKCEAVKAYLATSADMASDNPDGRFISAICDILAAMLDNPEPWITGGSVGTDWLKDRSPPPPKRGRPRKELANG